MCLFVFSMTKGVFDKLFTVSFILNSWLFLSPPDPFQWSPLSDVTAEDNQHTWQPAAGLTDDHSPPRIASSHSLADLLALYGAVGDRWQQQPLSDLAPLETSQLSAVLGKRDGNPASGDWPVPSKKKRNFSLGVAGKCCNHGCTKNDIGRLC